MLDAAAWNINTDEPPVLDYNTNFKSAGQIADYYAPDAFRSSDHDPVVVGLYLGDSLLIISPPPADGTYGSAYSQTIESVGVPTPTLTLSGTLPLGLSFVENGDGTATITGTPEIVGSFPLTVTASNGIEPDDVQAFTLVIEKALLTVSVEDETIDQGDALPSFTLSYSGFVFADDASDLDSEPTASVTITDSSVPGVYTITVSNGSDANYNFAYEDGTLTVVSTGTPTPTPTEEPTGTPTGTPTEEPTGTPTEEPTGTPTEEPTGTPTEEPTGTPTVSPTEEPTGTPTEEPTGTPTEEPTGTPTPSGNTVYLPLVIN